MQQNSAARIPVREILSVPVTIRVEHLPDENDTDSLSCCNDSLCLFSIIDGTMTANIDGQSVVLVSGDALMVNVGRSIHLQAIRNCQFYMAVASPLLFQNSICMPTYMASLTGSSARSFFLLRHESEGALSIVSLFQQISSCSSRYLVPYRLTLMGYLHLILAQFLDAPGNNSVISSDDILPESHNLDRMLNYIHNNFQAKIQLNDIADAGNVSRSRCSPIFRKYLHVTPIEYVNNYRLEISRVYLQNRNLSIASIASACGFTGQSYYTKLFVRKYGYTPSAYRSKVASS